MRKTNDTNSEGDGAGCEKGARRVREKAAPRAAAPRRVKVLIAVSPPQPRLAQALPLPPRVRGRVRELVGRVQRDRRGGACQLLVLHKVDVAARELEGRQRGQCDVR